MVKSSVLFFPNGKNKVLLIFFFEGMGRFDRTVHKKSQRFQITNDIVDNALSDALRNYDARFSEMLSAALELRLNQSDQTAARSKKL